ncbi:MAG TPA: class I SAM-dependent methyltransferase [Bacteroidales bacterium]|nr:class I SAM-dependent methyltransferase [Bacteroidales bacterium]
MKSKIQSPVTGSYNTRVIKKYFKAHFINLYQDSLNLDVSRFFDRLEEVLYVKCLDTNYRFFYPESIVGDGFFYEELQQFDWYYHKEKWEFDEALRQIKPDDVLLEIGAGSGYFLDKLKEMPLKNKNAIEFNQTSVKILKQKGYTVHECPIEQHSVQKENFYDVIVFFHVLEHIYDIKSFLNSTIKALKPGGKIIIAVPNCDAKMINLDVNLSANFPPHHVGHWNVITLKNLVYFYPIKLNTIKCEPLSEEYHKRYYRVWAVHIRNKYGFLGKALDKLLYPCSESFIKILSKKIKGHSIIVSYKTVK